MTLGEKIYTLRTDRKLSQEDLAEMLGVSRQSVSKWETDASVPELEKLIAISTLFSVSLDELVGREAPAKQEHTAVNGLSVRSLLGIVLIGLGGLGFLILCLRCSVLESLLLTLPAAAAGVLLLTVRKNTGFVIAWVLFVMADFVLSTFTAARWRFGIVAFNETVAGILMWAMHLWHLFMVLWTARFMRREEVLKKLGNYRLLTCIGGLALWIGLYLVPLAMNALRIYAQWGLVNFYWYLPGIASWLLSWVSTAALIAFCTCLPLKEK